MSTPNLADPDFEPTDEQFRELLKRAFADVRGAKERRLAEMRERIRQSRGYPAGGKAVAGE